MEVKSISGRIFKTTQNKMESVENSGAHTNPFGVSFKGNIINADVFEKTEGQSRPSFGANMVGRIEKSRLAMSAAVGSINQAFGARLNSIANFGRRIKANVTRTWDSLNNINVEKSLAKAWDYLSGRSLKMTLGVVRNEGRNRLNMRLGHRSYGVSNLLKQEVSSIGEMFKDCLGVRAEQKLAIGV